DPLDATGSDETGADTAPPAPITAVAPRFTGADADAACATAPAVNASRNAPAFGQRSSGDFASAFVTAARMFAGTCDPAGVVARSIGCTVMCCVAHSHAVSALNGSFPHSISY